MAPADCSTWNKNTDKIRLILERKTRFELGPSAALEGAGRHRDADSRSNGGKERHRAEGDGTRWGTRFGTHRGARPAQSCS